MDLHRSHMLVFSLFPMHDQSYKGFQMHPVKKHLHFISPP